MSRIHELALELNDTKENLARIKLSVDALKETSILLTRIYRPQIALKIVILRYFLMTIK
jgi:hypothetical protein